MTVRLTISSTGGSRGGRSRAEKNLLIKTLSLYEFTLWGRDLVSVVRIRESAYCRGLF